MGGVEAEAIGWHGQEFSAEVTLPPLAALWLIPRSSTTPRPREEAGGQEDGEEAGGEEEARQKRARRSSSKRPVEGRSNEVWKKNAASWARFPGCFGSPRPRWRSSVASSRAPRTTTPCCSGASPRSPSAYSVACITRWIPWERVALGGHALAIGTLQPLIVAALWLTGGADAYLGPMLVLPMLYVAYFFPARYAWPLAFMEILTYASPLVTSGGATDHLLIHRAVSYAVAYAGLVATIQFLKGRLVDAERVQHRMARVDPLTGLQNRRAFDEALTDAFDSSPRFTVLLADVDSFKEINDRFGHTTGDRVLRELAAHGSAAVRAGDCLARIGGDEFALVAPGAGLESAERLVEAVRLAGHGVERATGRCL